MDGIENDDPNTSDNNIDGLQSNFNDHEDDAGQDEDDDNFKYLKKHMNSDNDTPDDIVTMIMLMTKTSKFLELFVIHVFKMLILMAQTLKCFNIICVDTNYLLQYP
jgi:hypothetical protein